MCGIAGFLSHNLLDVYINNADKLLCHRGRDASGVYSSDGVTLLHRRLSILELTDAGAQPMTSKSGRYSISYNGEIYNHKELRQRFLSGYKFRGNSDTETLLALFELMGVDMLQHLVGMWALLIWDNEANKLFVSRDRFGQKPLYYKKSDGAWLFSSELKPLLGKVNVGEKHAIDDFIAHGNYGHFPGETFFNDVNQIMPASYAWVRIEDEHLKQQRYWSIPQVLEKDKIPFSAQQGKVLHDVMVEAVLSQTLSDVPIGVTLSGGIDSSLVAGILATYYDRDINLFTAQVSNARYDESKYVDAVINKYKDRFIVHRSNADTISIKDDLERYISIQEEPFGDPSIIAHGRLMKMAHEANIKVVLGGQGADEILFGYTNMLPAVLIQQLYSLQLKRFFRNIRSYSGNLNSILFDVKQLMRVGLQGLSPALEQRMRVKARQKRGADLLAGTYAASQAYKVPNYSNAYAVLKESVEHIHLPHLVHYDDRNAMHYSIEGRMPFLDHRLIEQLAQIKTRDFYQNGHRKHLIRESCAQYLPATVLYRQDKIGFYTPLIDMLYRDAEWLKEELTNFDLLKPEVKKKLVLSLCNGSLTLQNALYIWRSLATALWSKQFNVRSIE